MRSAGPYGTQRNPQVPQPGRPSGKAPVIPELFNFGMTPSAWPGTRRRVAGRAGGYRWVVRGKCPVLGHRLPTPTLSEAPGRTEHSRVGLPGTAGIPACILLLAEPSHSASSTVSFGGYLTGSRSGPQSNVSERLCHRGDPSYILAPLGVKPTAPLGATSPRGAEKIVGTDLPICGLFVLGCGQKSRPERCPQKGATFEQRQTAIRNPDPCRPCR